jgi:hypothetical protein
MLNDVKDKKRVQWEIHTVTDHYAVNFMFNVGIMSASTKIINALLSNSRFRMQSYTVNGKIKIGYGVGNTETFDGLTEAEAYTAWFSYIKTKERDFKAQIPLINMSQTQFDSLFSLYVLSGTWRSVQADIGTFDVFSAVKSGKWLLVADMIANGNQDRVSRMREASILVLADYGSVFSRDWLRNEGIQHTRSIYSAGIIDTKIKKQAEAAYYRQTGGFLPKMSERAKRQLKLKYEQHIQPHQH